MNKIKTIIISTSGFGNPVSDYYNFLAEEFINYGYKVIFIFDGLVDVKNMNTENKSFFVWPSKRPTKILDFMFLYKIIKKEAPVLCISNFGSTNIVTIVSYLLKVKNRINYIHTTSKQLSIDSNKISLKKVILKYRKKQVYKLNTLLFTNSKGTRNDTIDFYKVNINKIKVFNLLIKESSINYKNKNERENIICIVGRLHPSKGHKELLYMFKKSLTKFPELKLHVIGDGYLKDELIELSKELEINENVIFMGNIANKDIGRIFSNSLVSISSSLEEAYGLVNIEALREGTPLICTKTAGSMEILSERNNGVYIYHNKEDSLLNALTLILNDWESYSENALVTFKERFSEKENIKKQLNKIVSCCSLEE